MASRRLAISSLLCGDDPSAAPVAGPSYTSRPDPGPTSPSPTQFRMYGERVGYVEHQAESRYMQSQTGDALPLSFQSALHLRRRTPSPTLSSQSPSNTGSPVRRRGFKEIAFDNYQGQPGHYNDAYSHTLDYAEPSARSHASHREYPQSSTVATTPDLIHYNSSQLHTVSDPSRLPRQPRRPSFGEPHQRPQPSRHSTIHALVNPPSQPSTTFYSSHQARSPRSDQQYPPTPVDKQPSYQPPPSTSRPTTSPIQTLHRQHHPASVSPTYSTTSRISSPPSSASSQRPRSRHAIASLLTDSPPVPRASAASLPHILNSPTLSRGGAALPSVSSSSHGAHMGGLEALVQAATQERRRLSGEIRAEEIAAASHSVSTSTRSSPVVERGRSDHYSSPVSERGGFQLSNSVVERGTASQIRSPVLQRPSSHVISPSQSPAHILPPPLPDAAGSVKTTFAAILPQNTRTGIRRSHSPPFEYEEPPAKRRRASDGVASSQSVQHLPRDIPQPTPVDVHLMQASSTRSPVATRLSMDLQAEVPVSAPQPKQSDLPLSAPATKSPKSSRTTPLAEVSAEDPAPVIEIPKVIPPSDAKVSSRRIQSPVHGRKPPSHDKKHPPSLQHPSPPQAIPPTTSDLPNEETQVRHQDTAEKKDELKASVPARKKKKTEAKPATKDKPVKAAKAPIQERVPSAQPGSLPTDQAKVTEDDDPHDWLMEHYGGSSTSDVSHHQGASQHHTQNEEKPSAARPVLSKGGSSRSSGVSADASARISQIAKKASNVRPPARSRSPTPIAMLEEEIGAAENDRHARAATTTSHRDSTHPLQGVKASTADVDMDLDAELDLVAGPRVADAEAKRKTDDASEMDVEDELLSLLDDKPRLHKGVSHAHSRPEGPKAASPTPSVHTPADNPLPHPSSSKLKQSKHTDKTDRESMPPPHTPDLSQAQDSASSKKGDVVSSASTKKKDGAAKSTTKKQSAAKPRAPKAASAPKGGKALAKEGSSTPVPSTSNATLAVPTTGPSGKAKKTSPHPSGTPHGAVSTAKRAVSAVAGGASSRSRSTSVMPGTHDADKAGDRKTQDEPEEEPVVDDKLYCICKTKYDEDRVMIACDRCDEWYHTQCVNMPDLEVDLVDQFICPVCIASNPHLLLKTTYKRRCYSGVHHARPSSPAACHKPARGAVSKYCSDDCAVKYMQSKIRRWGGDKAGLWEGVKHADKREAVVMRYLGNGELNGQWTEKVSAKLAEDGAHAPQVQVIKPNKTKVQREIERLNSLLSRLPVRRDALKKEEEILLWREQLVTFAISRAEMLGECGWDQRLCFGDDEIAEFGSEVLQTYDSFKDEGTPDAMQVDGSGEWWCKGKKKCDRHAGWQKLRQAETDLDKEVLNASLEKITAEERELRNRIEDILKEAGPESNVDHTSSSFDDGLTSIKLVNGDGPAVVEINGASCARTKVNGTGTDSSGKKGKKRKPE